MIVFFKNSTVRWWHTRSSALAGSATAAALNLIIAMLDEGVATDWCRELRRIASNVFKWLCDGILSLICSRYRIQLFGELSGFFFTFVCLFFEKGMSVLFAITSTTFRPSLQWGWHWQERYWLGSLELQRVRLRCLFQWLVGHVQLDRSKGALSWSKPENWTYHINSN